MKRMARITLDVLAAAMCFSFFTSTCFAIPYSSYGYPKSTSSTITTVPILPYSANSTWSTAISQGYASWNQYVSTTKVKFATSTTCTNALLVQNSSNTWYGMTYKTNGGSNFTIILNKTKTESVCTSSSGTLNTTKLSHYVQSITAHELGHVVWLCDNPLPADPSGSIMNGSRDRNTLITPTQYDVSNVSQKYS